MSASIVIVEDEDSIQALLQYNFESVGYRVRLATQGEDLQGLINDEIPDLIILDWMLPGISGIDLCRVLKSKPETREIPVIMLTARGEEAERLRGLATGADDYITKPFSVPEVLARVKAILRRVNPRAVADTIVAGDISLNRVTCRVTRSERDIPLSPTEFRLLEFLMQNPGRVYGRSHLLDRVWGNDNFVDERTVDVHVGRLRKNLNRGREVDPIRTVRSTGYSFNERFSKV